MSISEMEQITLDEFNEWMAFFRLRDNERNPNPNKRNR
jgi:hypothetical protein